MKPNSYPYLVKVCLLLFVLSVLSFQSGFSQADRIKNLEYYVKNAPFQMPDIQEPEFPDRTFNITDYGAVGDGQMLNTQAMQHTIETCAKAGGGTVVVPPGLWLTGPIELKSNVNLHVERGAVIQFSANQAVYPIIKMPHTDDEYKVMPPLYGHDLTNVAITGGGIFDGNGQAWRPVKKAKVTEAHWKRLLKLSDALSDNGSIWWPSQKAMNGEKYIKSLKSLGRELSAQDYLPARTYMRPYMIQLLYCKNVLFDGPTFRNAPKFAMFPKFCTNMIIRNVTVDNAYWAQNGDGIDIGGGKNIAIYRCTVTAGDDGICMKSSPTDVGGFSNPALQNVIIAESMVHHGHGGFVIGSNTDGGIKNVSVKNCSFIGTDRGLRFKSRRGRGALVHNIYVDHVSMSRIVDQAIYFNTYYELSQKGKEGQTPEVNSTTPRFQDFHISHLYCRGANTAISMTGLPEMPIKDITLTDVHISAKHGFESEEVDGIKLNNVTILPKSGVVFSMDNSRNVVLNNVDVPINTEKFMTVTGSKTAGIDVMKTNLENPGKYVEKGENVSSGALTIDQ